MFELLSEFLVLSHVLFRLFNADSIVLGNRVKLCKSIPQLLKLVDLVVAELFSFFVLFFELGKFLSEVCESLCSVLDLFEYVWLALLNHVV